MPILDAFFLRRVSITLTLALLLCIHAVDSEIQCGNFSGDSTSYPFEKTKSWRDISGPLVLGSPVTRNITGAVVLIEGKEDNIEDTLSPYLGRGATALAIKRGLGAGKDFFQTSGSSDHVTTPTVDIEEDVYNALLALLQENSDNFTCIARITWENNPFYDLYQGPVFLIFVNIVPGLWALCNIAYASYKLHIGVNEPRWRSTPITVLLCEVLANLCRLCYYPVDPWETKRIFPFNVTLFVHNIQLPFAFGSLFIITLYWHEVIQTHKDMDVTKFLPKLRVYFYISIVSFFVITLVAGATGSLRNSLVVLNIVVWTIYILGFLGVCIFYNVTATRVILRLRTSRAPGAAQIRKVMQRSIGIGVLLALFVVASLSLFARLVRYPVPRMIVIIILTYPLLAISTLQISNLYCETSVRGGGRIRDMTPSSGLSVTGEPDTLTVRAQSGNVSTIEESGKIDTHFPGRRGSISHVKK